MITTRIVDIGAWVAIAINGVWMIVNIVWSWHLCEWRNATYAARLRQEIELAERRKDLQ